MENMKISRRTLAQGAAWAAPVVVASSVVPAYAASVRNYSFSASWKSGYQTVSGSSGLPNCNSGYGYVTDMYFTTDVSIKGEAPGFAIPALDGSPQTGVTLSDMQFQVAYPAGLVNNISVNSGLYTVSGPAQVSIPGAQWNTYDVWTFTFTGSTTGTTSNTTSWPGSPMTTTVDFVNDVCVPANGDIYYARWQGSYVTDNGFSFTLPQDWMKTPMVPGA